MLVLELIFVNVLLKFQQDQGSSTDNLLHIAALHLSNNSFSRDFSHFLCHLMDGVESSLKLLFLQGNLLSGEILNCWMHQTSLNTIVLSINKMTGRIQSSIRSLFELQSLHLHDNRFLREIHPTLQNCIMLTLLDGLSMLVGSKPKWIGGSL